MPSSTVDSLPHLHLGVDAVDDGASIEADVLGLFDDCAASLTRYVRGCGLTPEAADDVVQDAFIALFRHLRLGRPRDNLRGWLFRVAHRQAVKHRVRAVRRRAWESPLGDGLLEDAADGAGDPEALLAERRSQRRLRSAVRALPERHRHCLLLRAEGLGYRDIATVLGMSLGGVAKSLAHAFLRLSNVAKG